MKKAVLLASALTATLFLAGCAAGENSNDSSPTVAPRVSPAAEAMPTDPPGSPQTSLSSYAPEATGPFLAAVKSKLAIDGYQWEEQSAPSALAMGDDFCEALHTEGKTVADLENTITQKTELGVSIELAVLASAHEVLCPL